VCGETVDLQAVVVERDRGNVRPGALDVVSVWSHVGASTTAWSPGSRNARTASEMPWTPPDVSITPCRSTSRADPTTFVHLGNQRVDLEGDRAQVETYAYVTRRVSGTDDVTHWSEGAARLVDELERRAGRWTFVDRTTRDIRP
jgi:hypothetical protein